MIIARDKLCSLCPRDCRVDRAAGETGFCRTGAGLSIGTICLHRGEEPVLGGKQGICNVFFAHCNLQCLYCQNYQISRNDRSSPDWDIDLPAACERIEAFLDRGVRAVGFVSPSHCLPQMVSLIAGLRERGRNPVFIMNTNAYDRVKGLRSLAGSIDVYLPDLKYLDPDLAERYSGAKDYPVAVAAAVREMFRQKGERLIVDENGLARSGMIIRHLVLPGQVENSKACLRFIARELSPRLHLSLMAQYHPTPLVAVHPELGRTVNRDEYEEVAAEMERLGFENGWVQELGSGGDYLPDFTQSDVFE
ncbi:MAG: radical SAM protein [Candidatus Aureabacteria bacterium]|nr:radical SAM protein [Candidatus Auribacterota bacterium]